MSVVEHEIPDSVTLLASAARTASGAGSDVGGVENARALQVTLDITAVSGTTPTLDLEVQAKIGVKYTRLVTFAQKTATGTFVREAKRTLTAAPAEYTIALDPSLTAAGVSDIEWWDFLRVKYTIGGTTPSFTFSVTVVPVR
jgi:hypothetical protein